MNDDLLLRTNMLDAAIRHAKATQRTPGARRACVVFYLRAEEREARRRREYRYANAARVLLAQCRQAELITSLLETLRRASVPAEHTNGDPLCNTGPTSTQPESDTGSVCRQITPHSVKHSAHNRRKARVYEA